MFGKKIEKKEYKFKVFEYTTDEFVRLLNTLNKTLNKKERLIYQREMLPYEKDELYCEEILTIRSDENTMDAILKEYVVHKRHDIEYLGAA